MRENGWSHHNEKLCQSVGEKCISLIVMHNRNEEYSKHQFTVYTRWLHAVSFLTAVLSAIDEFANKQWLRIAIKLMSIVTAFAVKWYTSSDISNNIKLHKVAANEYLNIYNDTLWVLSYARHERPPGKEYSKQLMDRYNKVYNNSISIHGPIIRDFAKQYNNNNIAKPIIAGEMHKIEIHDDNSNDTPPISHGQAKSGSPLTMFRMRTIRNFAAGSEYMKQPNLPKPYENTPVDTRRSTPQVRESAFPDSDESPAIHRSPVFPMRSVVINDDRRPSV